MPSGLGHALYMKAIPGGKAKNDRMDARKIAVLLPGGMIPQASVYPAAMRATRDLLRRRMSRTRQRRVLRTPNGPLIMVQTRWTESSRMDPLRLESAWRCSSSWLP